MRTEAVLEVLARIELKLDQVLSQNQEDKPVAQTETAGENTARRGLKRK